MKGTIANFIQVCYYRLCITYGPLASFIEIRYVITRIKISVVSSKFCMKVKLNLRIVFGGDARSSSMAAVKSVLEVDFRFADQVVGSEQVPVHNADGQYRVLGKSGLEFETLSEHRIQLLRNVIFFIRNAFRAQLQNEVRIGLAVDIHRVKVVGLDHVDSDQDVQRIV